MQPMIVDVLRVGVAISLQLRGETNHGEEDLTITNHLS